MDASQSSSQPDSVTDLVTLAQEPTSVIQDWRASVLNILLPTITLAILPALIQTIYQLFAYQSITWYGPAIYILFYLALIYVAVRRDLGSTTRGWFLVVLTYLTGMVAMARGGLAGDGRIYLVVVPILAITLINTSTGIYAAVVSLVTFCVFGTLAHFGLLSRWFIRLDNPLDVEYWLYSALTMGTIVLAIVFVVTRFSKFQIQTLESSKKIARALADSYRQLEISNQQLEQKVAQRTSELSQVNRRLEFLATHDSLTGLPNRLLLYDRLDQAVKKSQRSKTSFALFFIDLDDFKRVNDSFGHTVGDQVLQAVGEAFSQSMRISDTVARLAGDEFALILYDVQSASDIEIVAQKISTALGQPIPALEGMMTITASIGVSLFPKHGADADSLFKKADQAMYLVKGQSKNGYRVAA
jgi:diguanylate cyclase (GGDEF)-like protein